MTPTATHLLEAATLVGEVGERFRADADRVGRLPDTVVEAIHESGLFRAKSPRELGGLELDPMPWVKILETVAYHDMPTAWNLMIGASSTAFAGAYLCDEGVGRIFRAGPRFPVIAGQDSANGTLTPCDGGYTLRGSWAFGSGIGQADFVLAGATTSELHSVLVFLPIDQVSVDTDSWNVIGLAGTGSYHYTVDDEFVPSCMVTDPSPFAARRGGPLYRQGINVLVANEIPAVVLGAWRRALDELVALSSRRNRSGSSVLADRPVFRAAVGRTEAQYGAMRALLEDRVCTAWDEVLATDTVSYATEIALRVAGTLICETSTSSLTELIRFGGGRIVHSCHPLARIVGDVVVAGQHIGVSSENYERAGCVRLGIDDCPVRGGNSSRDHRLQSGAFPVLGDTAA